MENSDFEFNEADRFLYRTFVNQLQLQIEFGLCDDTLIKINFQSALAQAKALIRTGHLQQVVATPPTVVVQQPLPQQPVMVPVDVSPIPIVTPAIVQPAIELFDGDTRGYERRQEKLERFRGGQAAYDEEDKRLQPRLGPTALAAKRKREEPIEPSWSSSEEEEVVPPPKKKKRPSPKKKRGPYNTEAKKLKQELDELKKKLEKNKK